MTPGRVCSSKVIGETLRAGPACAVSGLVDAGHRAWSRLRLPWTPPGGSSSEEPGRRKLWAPGPWRTG